MVIKKIRRKNNCKMKFKGSNVKWQKRNVRSVRRRLRNRLKNIVNDFEIIGGEE